jgi:predicted metal-binding membrane protein
MTNPTLIEMVLRRDRAIVLAGLAVVTGLAWAYTLAGPGWSMAPAWPGWPRAPAGP